MWPSTGRALSGDGRRARAAACPTYPFERQRYWADSGVSRRHEADAHRQQTDRRRPAAAVEPAGLARRSAPADAGARAAGHALVFAADDADRAERDRFHGLTRGGPRRRRRPLHGSGYARRRTTVRVRRRPRRPETTRRCETRWPNWLLPARIVDTPGRSPDRPDRPGGAVERAQYDGLFSLLFLAQAVERRGPTRRSR